jgi:hypothetical protein
MCCVDRLKPPPEADVGGRSSERQLRPLSGQSSIVAILGKTPEHATTSLCSFGYDLISNHLNQVPLGFI